ncbi:hypothetical protein ACSTDR_21670, partial [Vibrio vulnificus]|uniref:hypothetical protein n=1 Tax=Vibrio vulnificus TaxID=672 RepID=UPI003EDAC984
NKEAVASSIWLLFFLLECDSKLTHYHPNWLNFNSDNYPARGGLREFFADNKSGKDLISGFNAPLGTFSAKVTAAHALGLIQDNEFREITLIRKIRNEFGHSWRGVSFESDKVAHLVSQLPWCGPPEFEVNSTPRARFNSVIAILLADLMWRSRLVKKEQRVVKLWSNKIRENDA